MSRLIKEKRGQFVIIAALLIAALTLATTISIHEINIHRQSITYRPVDQFLLGTTSDMSRVLASSLANYTDGIINGNLTEVDASSAASLSVSAWKESLFNSYSSYGIRMKDPLLPNWDYLWNGTTSYSLSDITYDVDVDSYGFKGWIGRSFKYVQLQIFPDSITNDSASSSFNFTIKESAINENTTVPITGLPQNPDLQLFRVGRYNSSQPFEPADEVSLQYYGNGNYRATFNQQVDNSTHGIRLDLATPIDKIWVSANHFDSVRDGEDGGGDDEGGDAESDGDWSTLHLISGNILQPNYLYTPDQSHFYTPPLNRGHPSVEAGTSIPTPTIVTARLINVTVYLSSTPPKAAKTLNMTLGFTYNSTYYPIGSAIVQVSGKCIQSYSASINAGEGSWVTGFGVRTIPPNSVIQLQLTVSFDGPSGSGKIYVDGDTPSQINLY